MDATIKRQLKIDAEEEGGELLEVKETGAELRRLSPDCGPMQQKNTMISPL